MAKSFTFSLCLLAGALCSLSAPAAAHPPRYDYVKSCYQSTHTDLEVKPLLEICLINPHLQAQDETELRLTTMDFSLARKVRPFGTEGTSLFAFISLGPDQAEKKKSDMFKLFYVSSSTDNYATIHSRSINGAFTIFKGPVGIQERMYTETQFMKNATSLIDIAGDKNLKVKILGVDEEGNVKQSWDYALKDMQNGPVSS